MQVHFRLFVLGFCAYATNLPKGDQIKIEEGYNQITAVVPVFGKYVKIQFHDNAVATKATLEEVPTHPA